MLLILIGEKVFIHVFKIVDIYHVSDFLEK